MAKDEKEDVAKSDSDAPEAEAPAVEESSKRAGDAGADAEDASGEEKAPASDAKADLKKASVVDAKEEKSAAKADESKPPPAKATEKSSGKKSGSGKKKSSAVVPAAKEDAKPSKESAAPVAAREHAALHVSHGHKPDRRQYFIIFGVLFGLTVLEVALAQMPGISVTLMAIGLISMALTKAAFVGYFYMHLKDESKILRTSVMIPFAAPAIYALVLISDAAWRLTRW